MEIPVNDHKATIDSWTRSESRLTEGRVPRFLSFATLLLALAFPTHAGASTILNGSFEQGPPIPSGSSFTTLFGGSTAITSWTVTGSTIDYLGPGWDVSDGNRAIDLDGGSSIGGIQQSFATTSGLKYVVSFDLGGNPEGPPPVKGVRVSVDSLSQDYSFNAAGQTRGMLNWQPTNFSFVASGTNATLSFNSLSPSGNSYGPLIDNVKVNASVEANSVPEPSTLLLLATGLAACAAARRRLRGVSL